MAESRWVPARGMEARAIMDMAKALVTDRFHYGECSKRVGPKGGVYISRNEWRRNGANQTWKTDSTRFRIPIKYGMRSYDAITEWNVASFHAESDCEVTRD